MKVATEHSAHEEARELMRLGDLDGAGRIAEAEIQRLDCRNIVAAMPRKRRGIWNRYPRRMLETLNRTLP
jgi:hypothetical protein